MPTRRSPEPPSSPTAAAAANGGLHLRGVALVALAGVFWSLAGPLVRAIEAADSWRILFYRSLTLALTLLLVLLFRHRGRALAEFRRVGPTAVVGGAFLAVAFTGFVFSITTTTVANTLFVLSVSPFVAALLARMALGEPIRRATWVAMLAAMSGVALMVADGVRAGALFGNAMALVAVFGFSVFAVSLRRGRDADMLPAACLAGVLSAVAAAFLADTLAISGRDLALCAVMGVVQLGIGMTLFTIGSRSVAAAELALLSLTEVVLGPLLVWLGYGEVPSVATLAGGAIVLAAIVGRALTGMRRRPPPIGAV